MGEDKKRSLAWNRGLAILLIFLIFAVFAESIFCYKANKSYEILLKKGEKILEIKVLVDRISKDLWGIISVYDPAKSKKVDFEGGEHYALLQQIRENIYFARKGAQDPGIILKLEIIERTVNSLAKQMDSIKAQLALQEFDIESTKKFFQESRKVSTLKDSYVDDMERSMENIKIIDSVILKNVDEYVEKGFLILKNLNKEISRAQRRGALIGSAGFFIVLLLAALAVVNNK